MPPAATPLPPSCRLSAEARARYADAMVEAAALDAERAPLEPHVAGWTLSGRTFGVELEGYLVGGGDFERQQNRVRLALHHAGLSVWPDTATRPNRLPAWDVGHDVTVYDPTRGRTGGLEVRTPVLTGEAGLAELRAGLDALAAVGFLTNDSCALHVHVGVPDPSFAELRAFSHATLAQEDALDQLVIPARRGNTRRHALRYGAHATSSEGRPAGETGLLHAAIDRAPTEDVLERLVTPARKFHKFSTSHLVTLGTIENRMRDAFFTAPAQVLDWVRFTDRVVDRALAGAAILPSAAAMWPPSSQVPSPMMPDAASHPLAAAARAAVAVVTWDALALERDAARADYATWALGRPRDLPAGFVAAMAQEYAARAETTAPECATAPAPGPVYVPVRGARVAEPQDPPPQFAPAGFRVS